VLGEDGRRPAHLRGLPGLSPAEPHTEVADHVRGCQDSCGGVGRAQVVGASGGSKRRELLRETTLGYDHEQLLVEVRAWPGARVCQEAGPTGFGLHRALVAAGVESVIVAPGLVPSRPGDRVKTDKRDARRLAGPPRGWAFDGDLHPDSRA
jgi:hypothetical protein